MILLSCSISEVFIAAVCKPLEPHRETLVGSSDGAATSGAPVTTATISVFCDGSRKVHPDGFVMQKSCILAMYGGRKSYKNYQGSPEALNPGKTDVVPNPQTARTQWSDILAPFRCMPGSNPSPAKWWSETLT